MSGLYPDESHCTSEIGTLLFKPKSDWTGTVRVVDIVTTKGIAGTHNDYILAFTLVPKQVVELESREFTLTSRFRELDKLHKSLQKVHKQLYLRGVFPSFAPTKLIGAGEPTVVAERRHATEVFLNFALDHEVLRKSIILHQFLDKAVETAHTATTAEEEIYSSIDTGLTPTSYLDSPEEEQPTAVRIPPSASFTGDIDFQFPEVALGDLPHHLTSKVALRRQFPKLKMDLEAPRPNTSDYLVRAGILISTAQKAEAENEFELAFQCYKNAAKNLSEGLRTETDSSLRNSIKLKTAKYIVRAEQLFRTYLSYDGSAFNLEGLLADSLHLQDPSIFAFKSSNGALKDYSVVGVLPCVKAQNNVLLMEEKNTRNRYALKFLEKGRESPDTRIVLPTSIPHMAQIYKFFETEDHILLLLEYVSHGRLFDFLNRGMSECARRKRSKASPAGSDDESKKTRRYSYSGQRLHFTVEIDIERVAAMRDEDQSTADPSNCEVACTVGEDCVAGETDNTAGREFFVTSDSMAHAAEVEEEQPAAVKFRKSQGRQLASNTTTDSLYSCLKEVRELMVSRRSWPSGLSIPEPLVIHWTAQIASFLYMLHHQYNSYVGVIQPHNLLLDGNGNLVLTYHGRWFTQFNEKIKGRHYTAPESKDINWTPNAAGDIYTLGCILFELTTGTTLQEMTPHGLNSDSEELVNKNGYITMKCWDLLLKMLAPENERCTLDELRAHPYYSVINWNLYDNPHCGSLPNKIPTITNSAVALAQLDTLDQTDVTLTPSTVKVEPDSSTTTTHSSLPTNS